MTLLSPPEPSSAGPVQATPPHIPAGLFVALMAGYPVAWALGLGPAIWTFMALPMALWLIRQPRLEAPPGFALWALFLVTMVVSVVQVDGLGRLAVFMMRASWYLAAGVVLLYLVNQPSGWRTARAIVVALIALWSAAILGGYLAMAFPNGSWMGPAARLLPGALASEEFVQDLTSPQLAEVQRFGGLTLGRPAAPFAYTNSWGSTVALLTPFVFLGVHERRLGLPRKLLIVLLAAGLAPLITSLNRGAWLTLALGLSYGLVRHSRAAGSWRAVRIGVVVVLVAFAVAVSSGLLGSVTSQLDSRTTDSDEARSSLYAEAWNGALDSPFIGYGTPRPSEVLPDGPPIGTHGQFWMVLYSHGLLGGGLYALFIVHRFWRTGSGSPIEIWSKVALFIAVLQLPIYGQLPQQLFVIMAAAALPIVAARGGLGAPGEEAASEVAAS